MGSRYRENTTRTADTSANPPVANLPQRLAGPAPGWAEHTDVVVVGSGIAGLTCALHLREAGLHVTVVTKVNIDDGSTRWAQGGIAAVLDPLDTSEAHGRDTLVAGVGLCEPDAVDILVREGPTRVRELMRWGANFDRNPDGSLMLTREGGHHADRVVHAGGDATGAEIQRALHTAVRRDPWIRLVEHALVLDVIRAGDGRACGVTLHVLGEGTEDGVGAVLARAVVLATGGMGQVYAVTTNPAVSTGDGVALALRAGATVTDLEFVQFHPTALYTGLAGGQQPLITEALRGAGARLLDGDGRRFMVGQHELAELAPRDIVAKAIHRVMTAEGADRVWLDARSVRDVDTRFPTITSYSREVGIDPTSGLIPVAPAAHYASGGVRTDLYGRTSIPGMYACGEVACTGVHGANRLASNSLLEGLVFARRIAGDIVRGLPDQADPAEDDRPGSVVDPAGCVALQQAMSRGVGVLRSAESLSRVANMIVGVGKTKPAADPHDPVSSQVRTDHHSVSPNTASWEAANLYTVASALVRAAFRREETRGCHWREDFPKTSDEWLGHLLISLTDVNWEPRR